MMAWGAKFLFLFAMISFNDEKAIINYILNHWKDNVYLDIEIGLNERDQVKIDFFTNLLDIDTFTFLGKFKDYFDLISHDIDINIYYLTPLIEGFTANATISRLLKRWALLHEFKI